MNQVALDAAADDGLAHPERPVVAFTGDGGFLMAVAELQTSVRESLPIIVVVFDDQEMGLIRVKQDIKGIATYGVNYCVICSRSAWPLQLKRSLFEFNPNRSR
jgi:TPP-dependent trihydroxycyclohexane-1,2-dione (THcHDO) dehydratase